MKASNIREMTPDERLTKLEELREELFNLRVRAKIGSLENGIIMRNIRRDIARILTAESAARAQGATPKGRD